MKIYIASGLENKDRTAKLMGELRIKGHEITYDWTSHGDVRERGETVMRDTAKNEIQGIIDAELFIVLLPGGKGTHTELGAALATRENKRIWLWAETPESFGSGSNTCVFYHHPSITLLSCPFEELCDMLTERVQ